jgi:hypothetical protein
MPANLRGRPIEGIISDVAGNVIRNADIIIKVSAPTGDFVIDSVKGGGDGYFTTHPLKNGVYDIYESGAMVMRVYHSAQPLQLLAYKPNTPNVPSELPLFTSFIENETAPDINAFKLYIQIEPETISVLNYGNMFPLWNVNPVGGVDFNAHPFKKINLLHTGIGSESRLTHTRFDVEYFNPLISGNTDNRRVRWVGVPGIKFSTDSKIVLGLDYYSIVAKNYYLRNADFNGLAFTKLATPSDVVRATFGRSGDEFAAALGLGDIVKTIFSDGKIFWGILYYKSGDNYYLRKWKSSNFTSSSFSVGSITTAPTSMVVYRAMYQGIEDLNQSVGERFYVTENIDAQNMINPEEVFNYEGVL